MKKTLLIAFCIFSARIHATECKTAMCLVKSTLFLVTQGDMCRYSATLLKSNIPFDLMVVGRNQQCKFKKADLNDNMSVGTVKLLPNSDIYALPKESGSASDDDRYKPFAVDDRNLWSNANKNIMQCPVLQIIEPRIMHKVFENHTVKTYGYSPSRKDSKMSSVIFQTDFFGNDAIMQASNDLVMCYKNALTKGLKILDKKNIRVALAALSTEVGFPREKAAPVTFCAIIDFIKNNSGYAFVQLFVKKRCELVRYKKLIEEHDKNVGL